MKNIEMLLLIAKGLGHLRDKVVFVGGSTVSLYLTDPAVQPVRSTEDVDCVAAVVSRAEYYKLEEELERLGFKHAMDENHPICRWRYQGLLADIMPTEGDVLDFKNSWYSDGYAAAYTITLPGGEKIRIFTLPYFLASKIEAFRDRGNDDFLASPDMEDIVTILDGTENVVDEVLRTPEKVKNYLVTEFLKFLDDRRFIELLEGNLRTPGRVNRVKTMLSAFRPA